VAEQTSIERGIAIVRRLFGAAAGGSPLPADFGRITVEHLFGNVWSRPGLALEERSLATCAVLVALARENEQRLHFRGARNLGIPRAKLEELITHVAHYAGWPVAVSAFRVLDEVWKAMDQEPKA
jgi:4-carboxymuconolactone decarboxylase